MLRCPMHAQLDVSGNDINPLGGRLLLEALSARQQAGVPGVALDVSANAIPPSLLAKIQERAEPAGGMCREPAAAPQVPPQRRASGSDAAPAAADGSGGGDYADELAGSAADAVRAGQAWWAAARGSTGTGAGALAALQVRVKLQAGSLGFSSTPSTPRDVVY